MPPPSGVAGPLKILGTPLLAVVHSFELKQEDTAVAHID